MQINCKIPPIQALDRGNCCILVKTAPHRQKKGPAILMNKLRWKLVLLPLFSLCLLLTVFAASAWQGSSRKTQEALAQGVKAFSTSMQTGVVSREHWQPEWENALGTPEAKKAAIDFLSQQQAPAYAAYFTGSLPGIYLGQHQAAMEALALKDPQALGALALEVEAGVTNPRLLSASSSSPTCQQLTFSVDGWLTTLLWGKQGASLERIWNRDTVTCTFLLQEGVWKISSISQHQKEFFPETYEPNKGTYPTPKAALEALAQIDLQQDNPFPKL